MAGPLVRVRKLCLALPEAAEQETWDHPTFRVRGKIFGMYLAGQGARPAIWVKAPPGAQAILVGADPDRFFAPPYVGPKGWVGMFLDGRPDWAEVTQLVRRSFRLVAPRRIAALVEAPQPRPSKARATASAKAPMPVKRRS